LGVPVTVFGPIAGVLADRLERKGLLILSDLARFILVMCLTIAKSMWQIYIILILKGTFEALFVPAKNGKIKELVSNDHMEQAMSISTIIDQGSKIIGPIFTIDALTFLASALLLIGVGKSIHASVSATQDVAQGSFSENLKEGIKFIRGVPFLLYGTIVFSISMLVLTLADTQMVTLVKKVPTVSPTLFGIIMTSTALGMLLFAAILSQKTNTKVMKILGIGSIGVGCAFGGCAILAYMTIPGAWLWFPGLCLFGGGAAAMIVIPFQSAAQKRTPQHLSGRVFGTINSISSFATIAGPLAGGIFATVFGIIPVFIISASVMLVIGISTIIFQNIIERREDNVTQSNNGLPESP
jgi:MFS family permease